MKFIFKKEKGFTIIELVISIFILSFAVVGIFSAFSIMVILTSDTANQLTAAYLAQEGMEIVRNIRDTNWLNMNICAAAPSALNCPVTWVDGLAAGVCSTTGCGADYKSISMSGTFSGDYLDIDPDGFYGYTSGTQTIFKRKIIITPIADVNGQASDHILKVIVQVSWDKKATILNNSEVPADSCVEGKNCIVAEETLYDWYNYSGQ